MSENPINQLLLQWYGNPLSLQIAEQLARDARHRMQRHSIFALTSYIGIMQQMVADWWLDDASYLPTNRGLHYSDSRRKLALYHLIAGQLLISCKLQPAMDYLDMGLRHADGLIGSESYFALYNRHEELRFLKLSAVRQAPHILSELLNESRVMRKLAPKSRYSIPTN